MKVSRICGSLLMGMITLVYFYFVVKANADLSDGRFALFMDERITFDGVRQILHPESLRDFFRMVFTGDDQRYGRSLWNSIAIFSFLPEILFGEKAQIIAGRMTQVLFLFTAFFLLVFTFVRSWRRRILLLALLLTVPYTAYYMSMPKPEPLQLLFLVLFFYFYKKENFGFGWYWLFPGLAFGTKIAAFPVVLMLGCISLVLEVAKKEAPLNQQRLVRAIQIFMLGFAIAVPLFLRVLVTAWVLRWCYRWLESRYGDKPVFGAFKWLFVLFSLWLTLRVAKMPFALWFGDTFMNTTHGADRPDINFFSWVAYVFNDWMLAPQWFVLILCGAVFILMWVYLLPFLKRVFLQNGSLSIGLLLMACGSGLNLAIFAASHRLWGFYLFTGTALALSGLVAILDETNETVHATFMWAVRRYTTYTVEFLLLILITIWWAPAAWQVLNNLSLRTGQAEYKLAYSSYAKVQDFLHAYPSPNGERVKVLSDPNLFPPDKGGARFKIEEFWGPLTDWDAGEDIIILGKSHTPDAPPVESNSPEYGDYIKERTAYAKYVIDTGKSCLSAVCFERVATLPNGEILVRRKKGDKPV